MTETPAYFRLHADTWRTVSGSLTRAQAGKLLYAMAAYFFDGEEPEEGTLPREAQALFDIQLASLDSYRKNAIKGTKNRLGRTKTSPKTGPKPTPKHTHESTPKHGQESGQVLEGSDSELPAETPPVASKQTDKQNGQNAPNIINHESLSTSLVDTASPPAKRSGVVSQPHKKNSDTLSLVTGDAIARAAAAALGGAAPALPTLEEYRRVERKLEDEGLEALTASDRRTYHEGHAAYAAMMA